MFKVIKNYAECLLELTNLQRIFYVAPAGVAQLVRCHAALRGLRSIPGLARAQASAGSPFRSGACERQLLCALTLMFFSLTLPASFSKVSIKNLYKLEGTFQFNQVIFGKKHI